MDTVSMGMISDEYLDELGNRFIAGDIERLCGISFGEYLTNPGVYDRESVIARKLRDHEQRMWIRFRDGNAKGKEGEMGEIVGLEGPWKTDRVKGGIRTIEIEAGDRLSIAGQSFAVVRVLRNGKLLIRASHQVPRQPALERVFSEEAHAMP